MYCHQYPRPLRLLGLQRARINEGGGQGDPGRVTQAVVFSFFFFILFFFVEFFPFFIYFYFVDFFLLLPGSGGFLKKQKRKEIVYTFGKSKFLNFWEGEVCSDQ